MLLILVALALVIAVPGDAGAPAEAKRPGGQSIPANVLWGE